LNGKNGMKKNKYLKKNISFDFIEFLRINEPWRDRKTEKIKRNT
jgi:hypothetical protein